MRDRARQLRKTLTLSEHRLWGWLRNRTFRGYKFRRQVAVGHYVLDFYCAALKLAIEVDGAQHSERGIAEIDIVERRNWLNSGFAWCASKTSSLHFALMWVVPFLVLLPDKAKRNRTVLLRVSVVVLIGHWLDLYVTIVPAHSPEPRLTGWDLAIALGAFAAVGWAVTRHDTGETRLVLAPTV